MAVLVLLYQTGSLTGLVPQVTTTRDNTTRENTTRDNITQDNGKYGGSFGVPDGDKDDDENNTEEEAAQGDAARANACAAVPNKVKHRVFELLKSMSSMSSACSHRVLRRLCVLPLFSDGKADASPQVRLLVSATDTDNVKHVGRVLNLRAALPVHVATIF